MDHIVVVVITLSSITAASIYTAVGRTQTAQAASGLSITGISPTSGSQAGGTQVVIDGSGFMKTVTWKQVSASGYHTCAVADDDWIYCWGENYYGQLGNGASG